MTTLGLPVLFLGHPLTFDQQPLGINGQFPPGLLVAGRPFHGHFIYSLGIAQAGDRHGIA